MTQLICYLVLNLILSVILEKKMTIAAIAHSAVFVVIGFMMLFTTDSVILSGLMIRTFGKQNFDLVRESLYYEHKIIDGLDISSIIVISDSLIAIMMLLTVVFLTPLIHKLVLVFKYHLRFRFNQTIDNSRGDLFDIDENNLPRDSHKIECVKKIYLEKCVLII